MSVHDCLATGVPVVMAPADGLEKLFPPNVVDRSDPVSSGDVGWCETFARKVVAVLTSNSYQDRLSLAGRVWARHHTFERSVDILLGHLRDLGCDV